MPTRTTKKSRLAKEVGLYDNQQSIASNPARDLYSELSKEEFKKQVIDKFEKQVGIGAKKEVKKRKWKFHTRVLDPSFKDDNLVLSDLFNNPRFCIFERDKTWTMDGSYKIFVLYGEDLDFKEEKKDIYE